VTPNEFKSRIESTQCVAGIIYGALFLILRLKSIAFARSSG